MGAFLEATELKEKSLVPEIRVMELEDLDDLIIIPAERMIAEACRLNLNTDGHPWRWTGRFADVNNGARYLAEYLDDYRRATLSVANALAATPPGQANQSVRGASASFTQRLVTPQAKALMRRWSTPRRLYRT